jgi:TRAP transporter TAXI family solute receptor
MGSFSSLVLAGNLPKVIAITTFKMGSLGYTLTSAFREGIEQTSTMKVRVEPYGPDVARFKPLKLGQSEFTMATGAQGTCASYGLFNFSKKEWGPQPMRIVWRGQSILLGTFVPGDSKAKTFKDIKGLRAPYIPGAAAYNANMASHLAFGGFTMDDMKKVVCSGYVDALGAMVERKLDIAFAAPATPKVREAFAANGGRWLPMPHNDKEAWARLNKLAPWFSKGVLTAGPGLKQGQSVEMAAFPYQLYAYENLDSDIVYAFVKSMHKGYDIFKGMHKILPGWTLEQAVKDPSPIPYHEGAIRYFKEVGVWTAEMDKRQAQQVKNFNQRVADFKKK